MILDILIVSCVLFAVCLTLFTLIAYTIDSRTDFNDNVRVSIGTTLILTIFLVTPIMTVSEKYFQKNEECLSAVKKLEEFKELSDYEKLQFIESACGDNVSEEYFRDTQIKKK